MSKPTAPLSPAEAARNIAPLTGPPSAQSNAGAPATDNFSADVLAYADKNNVTPYLQPLLDATRRIFPNAEWVKVYFKKDPEVAGDAAIIYDVRVADLEYPESWAAHKAWIAELCRICPAPLTYHLTLLLDLTD
jgi:hypothetical protein